MMTVESATMRAKPSKFKPEYYVRMYELARSGIPDSHIAKVLGTTPSTFLQWKAKNPAVADALERGRAGSNESRQATFRDYVYQRLPENLKKLWEKINLCEQVENGVQKIEALLNRAGETARQHLFLYALVHCSFNLSEACRCVNIPKKIFDKWVKDDPDFGQLVDEIDWHKGNFFESALIDLVKNREPAAVIFASRTFNRDRGYGDKSTVDLNVKGRVAHDHQHLHATMDLDEILPKLSLETQKEILTALRQVKAEKEGKRDIGLLEGPSIVKTVIEQVGSNDNKGASNEQIQSNG